MQLLGNMNLKKTIVIAIFITFNVFSQNEAYVDNNGVKIFYVDYGPEENEPILLVQGLGGQLTFWPDELISTLQNNGFRPIVYDNRDVGLSENFEEYGRPNFVWNYTKFYLGLPMKSAYSLADMASDGIAVIDHLDLEQTHLLAMSMGGMITQRMVADNKDRFKSYVLIASMAKSPDLQTAPKGELRKLIEDRSFKNQTIDERVERSIRIFEILASPNVEFDEEKFREEVIKNINRSDNESGFSRQLIAILADKDRYDEVQSITTPTLVIHGKLDPLIPFEEGKKTAELIPNSSFLAVDFMSHLIDKPVMDYIAEPLVEFLEDNS